jgi:FtsP/CotA-like multicopper oxidase with cupredoxin domain
MNSEKMNSEKMNSEKTRTPLGRRDLLRLGLGSTATLTGMGLLASGKPLSASGGWAPYPLTEHPQTDHTGHLGDHAGNLLMGEVDHARNGFDPLHMLVDWDYGKVSTLPSGQPLREYEIVAFDKEIEIAPGLFFPAWTYNGRVPGPTLRCTEGDRLRIRFINAGSHPHTIHFHGFHTAEMDGVPGIGPGEIVPGSEVIYEFDAEPFGCHLYHCHAVPLKRHIHKGLYGAFIIDPKAGRPPAREFVKTRSMPSTPWATNMPAAQFR